MKKYNPVTGETCDATGSTELSQTDTKAFSPGKGFALDVGRVRESAERPSSESNSSCGASLSQPLGGKPVENWSEATRGLRLPTITINLAATNPFVPPMVHPQGLLPPRPHSRHHIP